MAIDPKLLKTIKTPRNPTLKKSYSVGNSTFLGNLQTQVVTNHVNDVNSSNVTYYGLIMASYESEDPAKIASVGDASSNYYTIIVKIPGLHDHLPDPTKYNNSIPILEMYPRFTGKLESEPQPGGIATVTFLDPANKQLKYNNGIILDVTNPGITGLPAAEDSPNSAPPISGMSSMKQKNCSLRKFNMIPAIDEEQEATVNKKEPSPENPQTVNSSFRSAPPKTRETGNTNKEAPSAAESLENENDSNPSVPVSDCSDKFLMSDYIDGFQYLSDVNVNNPDGIYPRYPLATSGWTIPSPFGPRVHPIYKTVRFHSGFDLAGRGITGVPVLAALPGKVIKSTFEGRNADPTVASDKGSGGGHVVIVHHEQVGLYTFYMHLQSRLVKKGDIVGYGTAIGSVNNTGGSTGPHLHFEIRKKRFGRKPQNLIDPVIFLKTKYRYFTGEGFGETNLRGVAMTQEEAIKRGVDGLNKESDISNIGQSVGLSEDL